ncbi:tetratricopeptide repeat protein [Actinomadura rifamycini]|uniref:tetratricopeptide repeat protein n=1 Tax=Actinomadura rifamycini TaxID=31962 RepID=UPI0003F505F3|nr:tetratricopeptide repeat protein [Actinomadura rifamycini]
MGYPAESVELYERGTAALDGGRGEEARELFRRAYDAGHPGGAHQLGWGALAREEDDRALEWFRRAAEMGYAASAFEVGWAMDQKGDLAEAERWYRQAAEGGHVGGMLNLGSILEKKDGTAEAMDLYRRAWERGEDKAAFNLGRLFDDGGKGDLDAAATWYGRAAERGNAVAAFNLGFVREDQGDLDGREAAWRRAADLGHPKAAYAVGTVRDRAGDEDAAAAWFRRAVREHGSEAAARKLGDIYMHRDDARRARYWSRFPSGLDDYSTEFELFAGAGSAAAIHRQDVLYKEIDTDGYVEFDLDARTLTVGGRTFRGVTLLGSFSRLDDSWLWAWANGNLAPDGPAVAPLRTIREYGERHDVPELVTGRLDLSGFPDPRQAAVTMAIGAAALLGGNGVHSCAVNDGKGSSFFHIDDPSLPAARFDRLAAPRLLTTASQVFPNDHRNVVQGFLAHYGFRIRMSADAIDGVSPDGDRVTVAFTEDGLIEAMTVGREEDA